MEDRFRIDQMVRFLEFWRAVFPASLAVLLSAFFILNIYLVDAKAAIESGPGFTTVVSSQSADLSQLEASTTAFNSEVTLISSLENSAVSQAASVLGDIVGIAASNGVTISHLVVQGQGAPVNLSATAASENNISAFKAALAGDPKISQVNLPLTGIQANPGDYSFSVTFLYSN